MSERLPLFDRDDDEPPPLPPQAARLAPKLRAMAGRGVYFGTSSWKYEGWLGSVYSASRYESRGKFSRKRFEADCLGEYAETFPTVCGDFAFYQFPTPDFWKGLFDRTPAGFLFGFKVPEQITVARWPGHSRYGQLAGLANESFLDPDLVRKLFLERLEPYRDRVGPLIFEFGTFARSTFALVDDFLARLGPFLSALPKGWRYAVEIRNPEFLTPSYCGLLADRNVAHVFNAWTRMPRLTEQVALDDTFTADFTVARALLTKGRAYEDAVKAFAPYERVRQPDEPTRDALAQIARRATPEAPAFLFVNNRLEGHAPTTIEEVAEACGP